MQLDVLKERERTRVNSRLQLKPDQRVEVPKHEENGDSDRALLQSVILSCES